MIKIHKEGLTIFSAFTGILVLAAIILTAFLFKTWWILITLYVIIILFISFIGRFFRVPDRKQEFEDGIFYSPADGKVVVIEETSEDEYYREKRLQLSIFMSVWDVHINYFPFSGTVKYFKYHPGKFLLAIQPKSSTLNERTSIVIENQNGKSVLLRQIAGAVARRIVSYAPEGSSFHSGDELGFIKFGSRVDIFFPVGTEILVKPGEQVFGSKTAIARF